MLRFKKISQTLRKHLEKWVTLEKMGYVFQKRCTFEKLGRFNNINRSWRNVCSGLK